MSASTAGATRSIANVSLPGPCSSAPSRLFYLDNIRMLLITGVVLGHLSATYGLDADWIYKEGGEASPIATVLVTLIMAVGIGFALGLFFFIAGYLTPAAYDRRGPARFMLDRLKRLGIPWLIYEVLINPLIHYAVDVHGGDCTGALYDCRYQGTFWQYLIDFPRVSASIGDGPVWFLEALLVFSALYALWRVVKEPAHRSGPIRPARNLTVPGNRAIVIFALAIGLGTFIVRFWFEAFVQYEPLHLEFARFPQYVALFVAGLWAYRRRWLLEFSDRQARPWRWIALACILTLPVLLIAMGALTGTLDEQATGGVNALSFAYSVWEGFLSVSMVIVVLTWFRGRFNRQGRLGRILCESSFTVFVIHPAIIVPLALALSGIPMNLSVKYLWVAPIAVGLCYLIAYALRKTPLTRGIFA